MKSKWIYSVLTSSNSRIKRKTYRLCVLNLVTNKATLSVANPFLRALPKKKGWKLLLKGGCFVFFCFFVRSFWPFYRCVLLFSRSVHAFMLSWSSWTATKSFWFFFGWFFFSNNNNLQFLTSKIERVLGKKKQIAPDVISMVCTFYQSLNEREIAYLMWRNSYLFQYTYLGCQLFLSHSW